MSRTPAKYTLADLSRAALAAKKVGYCVRLANNGEIYLEPQGNAENIIKVDAVPEVRL